MNNLREEIQNKAILKIKENNYNGCIVLSPGSGKSKIAIDCIKQGNFKNILITSPRTNLGKNWWEELLKWGYKYYPGQRRPLIDIDGTEIADEGTAISLDNKEFIRVSLVTIQTCYKWWAKDLKQFDFIVVDEVHTIGEEYFKLIATASLNNIPVLGLTGTPNKSDPWKKEVLYRVLPIIYEYLDSEKDGIINKIHYWIYEYELSDNFKVLTGTKDKKWMVGEAKQYAYLTDQYEKTKSAMFRAGATGDYFSLSLQWMKSGETKEQKEVGRKFFFAIKNRKEFLCSLNSSISIALELKEKILYHGDVTEYFNDIANGRDDYQLTNKLLVFSELTTQSNKLSKYAIHSNTGKTTKESAEINSVLLEKFNKGELRELASVRSLQLGLNLVGANWSIIESYQGSDVSQSQNLGRNGRLNINDIANVVIIRPLNTQMGDTWFESAFGNRLTKENTTYINNVNQLIV